MKNSKVLTVAGIIAMGVSPFLSAIGMRSTLKCEKITKKSVKEHVKKYWRRYVPSAVFTITGIALVALGDNSRKKTIAALSAGYAILAKNKYRVEQCTKRVVDDVQKSKIFGEHEPEQTATRFYDENTHQEFSITIETLQDAEYEVNRKISFGQDVTVNDWLDMLEQPHVSWGDDFGWNKYSLEEITGHSWLEFMHNREDAFGRTIIKTGIAPTELLPWRN